jgi:ABC-type nickel/cobalt efflux system permease component RcnA
VAKLRNFELTVSFLSASFYTNSLKGTLGAILVEFKWICWATIHRKINAPLNDQAYTHSHSHTHTHTHTTHTHKHTHTHTHAHSLNSWCLHLFDKLLSYLYRAS